MSRVELARIPALTFYKNSLTESRRTKAIPQLICVGKPCQLYTPEVVRCKSLGGSGTEIDWKCEADLPESLRFGRVEVSCEGSCSLEYRLVQIPGSLRNTESDNPLGDDQESPLKSLAFDVASTIFIWLAFVAIILYSRPEDSGPGFFPGGLNDNPSAPPPYSKTAPTLNEGWRPGFWTGAVLGGLGTHLFNNRQNTRAYDWERERSYRPPTTGSMFGQRRSSARHTEDRGEGSSNLGAMRQSTGFGGSSVR
ncbi:hypothetical protein DFH07DRAFT_868302 [Mycena maculata]|uniref:Store-operated calcium entry-associated regulatory factor n=1 Tax=Mycena maculata TaxID=230809 RepID=A0AAD7J418_9AGAR|nr:hypothetical protein DFH07DRAFT_868302 [Mycena maculata]